MNRSAKKILLLIPLAFLLLTSCTVVKNYPKYTPFVFNNGIEVTGEVSKDELKRLQTELEGYWDDSIKVNSIQQFGIRTVIKNPGVFDSVGVDRSVLFMDSYLKSQGYYNANITPVIPQADTVGDQYRVSVKMDIDVNRNLRITLCLTTRC